MAEDLTDYLLEYGFRVRYLHSEIDTLERIQIIRELRLGEFDVLVGVNLLREGLDLPEVSLVAILDADKEGFLRGETSLIQTIGRAARNIRGKVIMYADKETAGDAQGDRARPTAAARSRSPTTRSTASRRETIQKGISDITDFLTLESKVPSRRGAGAAREDARDMTRRGDRAARWSSSRRRCSPPPTTCASSTRPSCATRSSRCGASSRRRRRAPEGSRDFLLDLRARGFPSTRRRFAQDRPSYRHEALALALLASPALAAPTANFDVSAGPYRTGVPITFTSTSTAPDTFTITNSDWTLGGVAATGPTVTRSFQQPGNYQITLTVTSDEAAGANTATITKQVTVVTRRRWPTSRSARARRSSTTTCCSPPTPTIPTAIRSPTSGTGATAPPTRTPTCRCTPSAAPGAKTVTLTVTDSHGAVDTVSHDVAVWPARA